MPCDAKGLMTSAIFLLPFIRQVYSWVGGDTVDKKNFKRTLEDGKSLAFIPGGVQEVTLSDQSKPEEIVLYLKNRKGFVKIALEYGVPIVPVFAFGLKGAYSFYFPSGNIFTTFSRAIGFAPLVFFGRFGIPFGIPKPLKLHVVFGEPINIPKEINPSSDSIEKYHNIFLQNMESLFEAHKESNGYGSKSLKIL